MTAREKMIAYRERINADYKFLSSKCGVSSGLIAMVERGHVTHPNIVSRLQKLYSLSNLETEELLPLNRRKHGGCYEPDLYVHDADRNIALNSDKPREKDIEYTAYMKDKKTYYDKRK